MSFSDYDYSDDSNDSANRLTESNFLHHSNLPWSFQEKNDILAHSKPKFDYTRVIQENRNRRTNQINELRLSHARKKASLEARFNVLPSLDPALGRFASRPYYNI